MLLRPLPLCSMRTRTPLTGPCPCSGAAHKGDGDADEHHDVEMKGPEAEDEERQVERVTLAFVKPSEELDDSDTETATKKGRKILWRSARERAVWMKEASAADPLLCLALPLALHLPSLEWQARAAADRARPFLLQVHRAEKGNNPIYLMYASSIMRDRATPMFEHLDRQKKGKKTGQAAAAAAKEAGSAGGCRVGSRPVASVPLSCPALLPLQQEPRAPRSGRASLRRPSGWRRRAAKRRRRGRTAGSTFAAPAVRRATCCAARTRPARLRCTSSARTSR